MKTTKILSKKQLLPLLAVGGFNAVNVDYETYGRKTMAYIRVQDLAERNALEEFLIGRGQKVNRRYWPGQPITEVQVSYFKAKGWNE